MLSFPPQSPPNCETNATVNMGQGLQLIACQNSHHPAETHESHQKDEMNGFMTNTSAASVSKGDIEHLENKISILEKQISKIK